MLSESFDASALRRRAEELLEARSPSVPDTSSLSAEDMKALVYELQVRQIELEIENESLREAHESLQRSDNRYSRLFSSIPFGFLILDRKGHVLEANSTTVMMLGCPETELFGRPLQRFLSHEDSDTSHLKLGAIFNKSEKLKRDTRLVRENGGQFDARLIVS
ncbi:MAG: PAS domain S-box protein [Desulfomonilaceae bacterium]